MPPATSPPESSLLRSSPEVSLASHVRAELERMILSGELAAGERLNENAISSTLGVSRAPVREATRQLVAAGLLTMIRNRGVFVRRISLEDVLHVYDVRAGLARVAGTLAAKRATPAQRKELTALHKKMGTAASRQDSDTYYDLNRTFHATLFGISANPRLIEFNATTERDIFLFLRRGVTGPARLQTSNRQHQQILDAITRGDEVAAATHFENHILTGKQRMLESLEMEAR